MLYVKCFFIPRLRHLAKHFAKIFIEIDDRNEYLNINIKSDVKLDIFTLTETFCFFVVVDEIDEIFKRKR
jgi:hypothetical protein